MNQWFVYQGEGSHVGPVTTELLVRGLAAGRVPKDAHVAMSGSAQWQPVLRVAEIATALSVLEQQKADDAAPVSIGLAPIAPARVPPEPPESEADPTEVIRRDEMLKAGLAAKRLRSGSGSGAPPKPPMQPRSTNPPPLRPSGSMGAAIAPSKAAIPAAPPVARDLGPAAAPEAAPPSPVPPPPTTVRTLPPPPAAAVAPPVAPPAHDARVDAAKDAPKTPLVDRRTAFLLPFGTFALFLFLSLIVIAVAIVKRP